MNDTTFSRRGFLTRAAAGAVGLLGSSVVGGLSTRAWARPLHHLRATGRPVIGQPRSAVDIGLDEALRREQWAFSRPDVQSLVRDLVGSGYKRVGEPVGADGVAGYETEGGHSVCLGFAKDGSDTSTVVIDARWWDQRREPWPCDDLLPDVYSREVIRGVAGVPPVVRFRYVDEQGGLTTREESADVSSLVGSSAGAPDCSELDCHPHPPGPCPAGCTAACSHCRYPRKICSGQPESCPVCVACSLCIGLPGCATFCALVCGSICEDVTSDKYCCDYSESVCCPFDWAIQFPVGELPDCLPA